MTPANIIALLTAAAQLAPVAEDLINAVKLAISEGRDATDDEVAAAREGNDEAGAALDAALAAGN